MHQYLAFISIGLHIPELQQSRPQYGEITVFGLICGKLCEWNLMTISASHFHQIMQSVQSVGFGMVIEQISCGANFMMIGPQENVSLRGFRP